LINLVGFSQIHRNVNFYNELRDEFFIDFGKLFLKVVVFLWEVHSAIKTVLGEITPPAAQLVCFFL